MKGSEEQPPGSGTGRFQKVSRGEEEKVSTVPPGSYRESAGQWVILTGTWRFPEQGRALVIACNMWVGGKPH